MQAVEEPAVVSVMEDVLQRRTEQWYTGRHRACPGDNSWRRCRDRHRNSGGMRGFIPARAGIAVISVNSREWFQAVAIIIISNRSIQ